MKTSAQKYRNCFLIIIFIAHTVVGEIKNGYEREIGDVRQSLKTMTVMLRDNRDWSSAERKSITSKITYLQRILACYQLTENLLVQFRLIAPELYLEIDTIRDKRGRAVDVYVKFIPHDATSISAWGATYIDQLENDVDAYRSSYGPFTVSIKIWIVNKALLVLAHELGHVKYQVPNLAAYVAYHRSQYVGSNTAGSIGHNVGDRSGRSAEQFEKMFSKSYTRYVKGSTKRFQNPVTLLGRIRRNPNGAI